MNLEMARNFFMWCSIMNYGLLILWAGLLVFAHDSFQRFNEFMLRRKIERFDTLHYAGLSFYKIGIILFNIVPWIALVIIRRAA
jgi:hypothetical protein